MQLSKEVKSYEVAVEPIKYDDERIGKECLVIADAWREMGGDPEKRKQPKDDECSGPDWELADEGVNVATDFAVLEYRTPVEETYYELFRASADKVCIGYMMLEGRSKGNPYDESDCIFLRWLIGHPKLKGAGRALVSVATKKSIKKKLPLIVQSAKSAVPIYEHFGFKALHKNLHRDTDEHCGCALLIWAG